MNIQGDKKKLFKIFYLETYNTQEITSKEEANKFDSWPYPKEILLLLVADTLNCDHGSTDSRAT